MFSFSFFSSLLFSCLLFFVVLICFLLLAVYLEVFFSPEDPASTCGETQCSLVCFTDDRQLQSAPKVTLASFCSNWDESDWLPLFLCFLDALCVEGDCCFGLLVDAFDVSFFFVQKNVSLLNVWHKRGGRVVDNKQLVRSATSALRDALLTAWPCRLVAVLDEIERTVAPLPLDKAAELRRLLLLAATLSTLKKVLACDDAILYRIAESVFLESVEHCSCASSIFLEATLGNAAPADCRRCEWQVRIEENFAVAYL